MKSRKSIAVIGEGITEKFYIESLKGLVPFDVKPKTLGNRASNLKSLEKFIEESIGQNYDYVCCLIDMDTKHNATVKSNYLKLKKKYHNLSHRNAIGAKSKVLFFETERCIELWFLYHFLANPSTKQYKNQGELIKELKTFIPKYDKSKSYFESLSRGVHRELTEQYKGSLKRAVKNGKKSIETKGADNREYSYTELHDFVQLLGLK